MLIRARWISFGLMTPCLLMLVSCATLRDWFARPGLGVPVTVAPVSGGASSPPTPPNCTALPVGMALTATVQSTGVVVEVVGLQEGELPTFQYMPAGGQVSEGWSMTPGQPVGPSGRAVDESWVATTAKGSSHEIWDIRVIHARGVACARLVLPPS